MPQETPMARAFRKEIHNMKKRKITGKRNESTRFGNLHNIRCHEYDVTIGTQGHS